MPGKPVVIVDPHFRKMAEVFSRDDLGQSPRAVANGSFLLRVVHADQAEAHHGRPSRAVGGRWRPRDDRAPAHEVTRPCVRLVAHVLGGPNATPARTRSLCALVVAPSRSRSVHPSFRVAAISNADAPSYASYTILGPGSHRWAEKLVEAPNSGNGGGRYWRRIAPRAPRWVPLNMNVGRDRAANGSGGECLD